VNLSLIVDALQPFASIAAPIAVTALWQGIIVTSGLAICVRFAPRISAAHRFLIWAAGFVALVALPFLPQFWGVAPAGAISGASAGQAVAPVRPLLSLDLRWSLAIGAFWILASFIRAADLAVHSYRLRKLWKSAVPVEARTWGRREAEICTTRQLDRPSVIGFFAPRILIPEWLFNRLTPNEMDQIVLHEAEHLRRRDDWTNLLQKLCLVVFPLNAGLWWMERQLSKTREMACDEGVIRITRAPRAYAAFLTSLAESGLERRTEALSLGVWQRRPELVQRVHRILRRSRTLHPVAAGAVLAALGGGLSVVTIGFAHCPQLVAFVPAHEVENEALAARIEQNEAGHLMDASYTPASRRSKGTPGFYAVQTKAVMRESEQSKADTAHKAKPATTAGGSPHPRMVEAKLTNLRSKPAAEQQEQQWIVFTSFEQVGTSDGTVADYDTAQSLGSTTNSQPLNRQTSRVTITRLILRVLPTTSNSPQQGAAPLRDGWLVIQL
jgi:beta-lactamase regulating signal transducer with metallopeptidase domain